MGCLPTTNNYATKDWVTPYVTMIRFNRNFSKNINFGQLSASRCICIPWSLGSAGEAGQDCFKECLHITRLKLPWYFLQSVYPTLPFLYLWSEMCWFRAACSFEILSQNNEAQIQMHWLKWEPQARSITVSEPHNGKSSVRELHNCIVNLSEPQTLSATVREPHCG